MENIDDVQRLMLANQFRILAKLDGEEEDGYNNKKAEILEKGYEWHYSDIFEDISGPLPKEVSDETMDILEMFRHLGAYIEQLPEDQRATLDLRRLSFDGFDQNNDRHYNYMRFIVEKDGRYEDHKGTNFNSHTSSSIGKYRRMLNIYNERRAGGNHLAFADIQDIQNAVAF